MDIKFNIYGSENSRDIDIMVVVEKIGNVEEAKKTIESYSAILTPLFDKPLDVHLITVENGVVIDCSHGSIDEINNSLYDTYNLHNQSCEAVITRKVDRNVILKYTRAIRSILTFYSRVPELRPIIKPALKGTLKNRIDALKHIDVNIYSPLGRNKEIDDIYKVIAFQISQALGLFESKEIYTKTDAYALYPELKPYLCRDYTSLNDLQLYIKKLIDTPNLNNEELSFIEQNRK